jgi:hypothetical protein
MAAVTAPPPGPAQPASTNPPPRQPPVQDGTRIGRVLGVLGALILYGQDLIRNLRQHAGTPAFTRLASRFPTTDLTAILRRIARGLLLAVALEKRLQQRAARGRDLTPSPVRAPRKSAAPRPRTRRARPPAAPDLVKLPTPQEIAALLRRKPLGTVIADICRDLGIVRGDVGPELWHELRFVVIEYGGSFARYISDMIDRALPLSQPRSSPSPCGRDRAAERIDGGGVETPQSSPPVPPALATGPP